ncbi:hypothetical protein GOP47_0012242 [Adiantum capillus-veneris]|uniref:Uncharacterized protein n=1 Tax=Adiantum capillus-veneris TaxID=13818 RepID=A0A9D4UR17_ADICA|nr:hypothetical protein GOP47_0012242 [Adiantum capillus-veneris]
MQLHRVVHTDVYVKKLRTQSSWSKPRCQVCLAARFNRLPSSLDIRQMGWGVPITKHARKSEYLGVRGRPRYVCAVVSPISFPSREFTSIVKGVAASSFASVIKFIQESRLFRQCAPAVAVIMFAMWGLGPILRVIHRTVLKEEDSSWKDSQMHFVLRSFVRPLLLWVGVIFVCRAFDPLVLSTEASQAIKQRFLNFVRSLSTVLAFAQCSMSLTHQLQKVMSEGQGSQDSRSLGAQFVSNAVYTAVWVAAVCLFMELLGFSTQKWLTAGGLGTVLLTLAGREIFTNFLSSIMIHATRPFVLNEWIQTKIDGYEVSGTVEHVGWWSPTIVRGDDREAVHIPNHKFTVSVVRNLSQKSHWRIKTHFGISHLDVSKVPNIVADMRKVLAKHPQVEQRRLHRRVFFDNINPENQAIMVLISCFVKTPHFEEYLRVKEVILLDLLKVISHHHARLATPIRSVQRVQEDIEPRTSPFRDMNRTAEAQGRPYLLVEATAVASGARDTEQSGTNKNGASNSKEIAPGADAANQGSSNETPESPGDSKVPSKHKPQLEGLDSMGLNSKDITLLGAAFEKPPAHIPESSDDSDQLGDKVISKPIAETSPGKHEKASNKAPEQALQAGIAKSDKGHTRLGESSSHSAGKRSEKSTSRAAADLESVPLKEDKGTLQEEANELDLQASRKEDMDVRLDARRSQGAPPKLEADRGLGTANSSAAKAPLQENLVLGVALDGPKRTLPLDEVATVAEHKELVGSRNGNSSPGKERRDGSQSPSKNTTDSRER